MPRDEGALCVQPLPHEITNASLSTEMNDDPVGETIFQTATLQRNAWTRIRVRYNLQHYICTDTTFFMLFSSLEWIRTRATRLPTALGGLTSSRIALDEQVTDKERYPPRWPLSKNMVIHRPLGSNDIRNLFIVSRKRPLKRFTGKLTNLWNFRSLLFIGRHQLAVIKRNTCSNTIRMRF